MTIRSLLRRRAALAFVLSAALVACDDGDGSAAEDCAGNDDCPADNLCIDARCYPTEDTDGDSDGLPDAVEVAIGTNPDDPDTDGDGRPDGFEVEYRPGEGVIDARDTDGDGKPDALESLTNDADDDGVPDQLDPCDDDPTCPATSPERCNGRDDDDDGQVDEDFPSLGEPCTAGVGICAVDGERTCTADGGGVECTGAVGAPEEETCDGRDNDCDAEVDEGFGVGDLCEITMGGCSVGAQVTCLPDGTSRCFGEGPQANPEVCNDKDDDCDGEVDEDIGLDAPCTVGVGACAAPGQPVCGVEGEVVCAGRAGEPAAAEACNGVDDDCDGTTDEGFDLGVACSVGVGACAAEGVTVCGADDGVVCGAEPGQAGLERCNGADDDCDGEVDEDRDGDGVPACEDCSEDDPNVHTPAEAELCNGVDDDCDGTADEGLPIGAPCAVGQGACRAMGTWACAADGTVECQAAEGGPQVEICNQLDDDCDGEIDEDHDGDGVAACADCRPDDDQAFPGATERCNGLDDDCDEAIDEEIGVGAPCESGVGACAREGSGVCGADGLLACDAAPGDGSDETCNGVDDDCDGAIDEGFDLGGACQGGVGLCAGPGAVACGDDGGVVCVDIDGPAPATELCSGLDEDCDGSVDEVPLADIPWSGGASLRLPDCDALPLSDPQTFDVLRADCAPLQLAWTANCPDCDGKSNLLYDVTVDGAALAAPLSIRGAQPQGEEVCLGERAYLERPTRFGARSNSGCGFLAASLDDLRVERVTDDICPRLGDVRAGNGAFDADLAGWEARGRVVVLANANEGRNPQAVLSGDAGQCGNGASVTTLASVPAAARGFGWGVTFRAMGAPTEDFGVSLRGTRTAALRPRPDPGIFTPGALCVPPEDFGNVVEVSLFASGRTGSCANLPAFSYLLDDVQIEAVEGCPRAPGGVIDSNPSFEHGLLGWLPQSDVRPATNPFDRASTAAFLKGPAGCLGTTALSAAIAVGDPSRGRAVEFSVSGQVDAGRFFARVGRAAANQAVPAINPNGAQTVRLCVPSEDVDVVDLSFSVTASGVCANNNAFEVVIDDVTVVDAPGCLR